VAAVMVSCKKDKPVTSESNEVTTTKDGNQYTLDTLNSKVEWKGYKIFKSESTSHFGTIKFESGDVTVKEGKLESGKFVADMGSLTSEDLKNDAEQLGKLNGHLKSGDFFEVEKYPTAKFEITSVTAFDASKDKSVIADATNIISGNLTIKDKTVNVTFPAKVNVTDNEVSVQSKFTINRQDWGLAYGTEGDPKDWMISQEVDMELNITAKK